MTKRITLFRIESMQIRILLLFLLSININLMSYDRVTGEDFASRSEVISTNGMVATSHPLATQIGLDILKNGGNAIDAAIAANIALGLMEPTGNGIGGDLFAIIWDQKTQKLYGLNASGPAPINLSIEYFKKNNLQKIPSYGPLPVTVPGAVDGWIKMHERFGLIQFSDLFKPTIDYAREGFPITETIAYYLQLSSERFESYSNFKEVWMPNNKTLSKGDIFKNPLLAKTLEEISKSSSQPVDFPIQFFCISLTFSGQPLKFSRSFKSWSENFVILKNHCDNFFLSTTALDLQPLPFITCSLANTVFSTGSQLT